MNEFAAWKLEHSRTYSIEEEKHRFIIFMNNLKMIKEHNKRHEAGLETFFVGLNHFADLLNEEFASFNLLKPELGEHNAPKNILRKEDV